MKFQEKVWNLIKQIPKGKVSTYKILAEKLGTKSYRAVGMACTKNPNLIIVPCYRVVRSDGFVGNYSASGRAKTKMELLQSEGIKINDGKILDFDKVLFKFR